MHKSTRPLPVVLLVNNEWTARSVESILGPDDYTFVKAYTGRQATDLAAKLRPDLVIVDYALPDARGLDTCRTIRELATVDKATPFVIVTAASLSRRERHECFRDGVWEIFSSPFDAVEFVGKVETFLEARREIQVAVESTHRDSTTGLYNRNGLLARAAELIAEGQRCARWAACVAVGPKQGPTAGSSTASVKDPTRLHGSEDPPMPFGRITATLAEATRGSDSTGVLGANDFFILAPGTDEEAAAVFAQRLAKALNAPGSPGGYPKNEVEFTAGYYAFLGERGGSLSAQDVLGRTSDALRSAQHAEA